MSPRVLVIDDDVVVTDITRKLLSRAGIEVATASDGAAALRALEDLRPDLIILDVAMPALDGLEVLRRLRKLPRARTLPVILLTNRSPESLPRDQANGVDLCLTKPFRSDMLVQSVVRLLGASRQV